MTLRDGISDALLAAATAVALLSALGFVVMRDVYERLHFIGPLALVALPLLAAGICVHAEFASQSIKAVVAVVIAALGSPVLTHATARVAHQRQRRAGQAGPGDGGRPGRRR